MEKKYKMLIAIIVGMIILAFGFLGIFAFCCCTADPCKWASDTRIIFGILEGLVLIFGTISCIGVINECE